MGGGYLANPNFLKEHRQTWNGRAPISSESFLFPKWIEDGESIFGFQDSVEFIDIGIPADYKRCQELFDGSRINLYRLKED